MNYALFVIMLMTLVSCDTVPTHPDNEVHKVHLNIIKKHKKESPYPEVDSNPIFLLKKSTRMKSC